MTKTQFFQKFIALVAIIGLLGPSLVSAQSEAVRSAREELVKSAEKLDELNSSETILTPAEAAEQEFRANQTAVSGVLSLTQAEISDLRNGLNDLKNVEAEFALLRITFLQTLNDYDEYLAQVEKDLENALTVDEVRSVAKSFKEWRGSGYDLEVVKMINFRVVFQMKSILKKVDERITKISAEVKRLKTVKIKTIGPESFLNQATSNIKLGRELTARAQEALRDYLPKSEEELAKEKALVATLSEPVTMSADSKPKDEVRKPTIGQIIESASTRAKDAYKNLIDLNQSLKSLLK